MVTSRVQVTTVQISRVGDVRDLRGGRRTKAGRADGEAGRSWDLGPGNLVPINEIPSTRLGEWLRSHASQYSRPD